MKRQGVVHSTASLEETLCHPVQLQDWNKGGDNRKAEKQAPDQLTVFDIFQISASFIFRGKCSSLDAVSVGSLHLA